MLSSRLYTSSSHDVTASGQQPRLAAAAATSTRRHSMLATKKDVTGPAKDRKSYYLVLNNQLLDS